MTRAQRGSHGVSQREPDADLGHADGDDRAGDPERATRDVFPVAAAAAARREGRVTLSGPDRYVLTITPASFAVECAQGTPRFSGIATSRKPKLYIVSVDDSPIYVSEHPASRAY